MPRTSISRFIHFMPIIAAGIVASEFCSASEEKATNPIIFADVPDVAVIRVGDTYYMSSTTMHMSPGVPIMKSKDLVDWDLVNYAYKSLGDNDALNLENGQNAYGRGSWASSLRHYKGVFYVTTFSSTTGRTHVYTTKDIENGPWEAKSFEPSLHDSSLFFDDDGRVYMMYGGGNLRLVELEPDLSGVKANGFHDVVIPNASAVAGDNIMLGAEGSQLLKHDGKYYVFNITWPRGGIRTQIVHRADKITGPYEGRVVLSDEGVAQGTIVDSPNGDWYALLFQDYSAVGRAPFLVPVKWEDGWPVFGIDGKAPLTLDLPADPDGMETIVTSDEFNRVEGGRSLPLAWQWNHNPVDELWSLDERPGWLRLTTGRVDKEFVDARNSLTQRTFGPECAATTALDTSAMKEGDYAGLGMLQRRYGVVGVKKHQGGASIVMTAVDNGTTIEEVSVPLDQKVVHFRAECDFSPRREDKAYFFYSFDGEKWTRIGQPLKMQYTLPHFMGYRFALFNFATEQPGGSADFDYFRISDTITVDDDD